MIDVGIGYALLAACFGGAYIFSIKRFLDGVRPPVIAVVASATSAAVYVPYVLWTTAGTEALAPVLDSRGLTIVLGTIVVGAGGFMLFLTALEVGDVSYVAPLSKIVPAFVLPVEVLVLQVFLTPAQAIGVGIVTIGVYFANYQGGALMAPIARVVSNRAARLALGSAAAYGLFDVSQRFVLQELGVHPSFWVLGTRLGTAVLVLPVAYSLLTVRTISDRWKGFAIVGALNACLAHFAILAFSMLPASIASPIVNAQSVVAVVLGAFVLREIAFRYRILGAGITVVGIGLIVSG